MSKPTFKDRLLNFYRSRPLAVFGVLLVLAALGAVVGMILLVSIFERKQEARNPWAEHQDQRHPTPHTAGRFYAWR